MAIRYFSLALLSFAFCTQLAFAQVNTATISGTLHDSSGAVLPGASVTIVNQETGISRTVITNETGRYSAPALALGIIIRSQLSCRAFKVRSVQALPLLSDAKLLWTLRSQLERSLKKWK